MSIVIMQEHEKLHFSLKFKGKEESLKKKYDFMFCKDSWFLGELQIWESFPTLFFVLPGIYLVYLFLFLVLKYI